MKRLPVRRLNPGEMYYRPHDGSLLFILGMKDVAESILVTYQLLLGKGAGPAGEPGLMGRPVHGDVHSALMLPDETPFRSGFVLIAR